MSKKKIGVGQDLTHELPKRRSDCNDRKAVY